MIIENDKGILRLFKKWFYDYKDFGYNFILRIEFL